MRGYDLYFLVVAKLLNKKYLRLLNFYFHTLIQQRHKIKYYLVGEINEKNKKIDL